MYVRRLDDSDMEGGGPCHYGIPLEPGVGRHGSRIGSLEAGVVSVGRRHT